MHIMNVRPLCIWTHASQAHLTLAVVFIDASWKRNWFLLSRALVKRSFRISCFFQCSILCFFYLHFYGSSKGLAHNNNHLNPSRWQRNAWFPNHRTDCSAEEEEAQAEIHRSAVRRGSLCNGDKMSPLLLTLCRTLGPDQMNLPMRWAGL